MKFPIFYIFKGELIMISSGSRQKRSGVRYGFYSWTCHLMDGDSLSFESLGIIQVRQLIDIIKYIDE